MKFTTNFISHKRRDSKLLFFVKPLHQSFLSAIIILAFGQFTYGQQLLDNFNRANSNSVGTSLLGGVWVETETAAGAISITNNQVVLGSNSVIGKEFLMYDCTGKFVTTLSGNTKVITWMANIRQSNSNPDGFANDKYGIAFVLGATASNLTASGTNGYAVVFGQSGGTDPIRLASFTNGITADANLTNIITGTGTDFADEYLAIKVTYNPANNNWSLFYASDPVSFPDPYAATYTQVGSATLNTTYTSSNLKFVGFFYNHRSSATENAFFDNVYIPIGDLQVTTNPVTQTVCEGANVALTSVASGAAPITIKWQKFIGGSWTDIPGANASPLSIPSAAASDNGQYRAVFSNSAGTIYSSLATLKVNPKPTVSAAATNTILCSNASTNLSSTGASNSSSPQTFSAFPNAAIPNTNAAGVTSTITISGAPSTMAAVTNLSVRINATHASSHEFEAYLIRPGGSILNTTNGTYFNTIIPGESICLLADQGSGNLGFVNTVFSDAAPFSIALGSNPFTGSFKPENAFSTLTGNPNGTWTLKAVDDAGGSLGTLVDWSITMDFVDGLSFTWTSLPAGFSSSVQNPGAVTPLVSTNYVVTATNTSTGCTASSSVPISVSTGFSVNCVIVSNESCAGNFDGAIQVNAIGGTAPYTGDGLKSGLAGGNYTYTVTDATGCTTSCSTTLTSNPVTSITQQPQSVNSCEGNNIFFSVAAVGGSLAYQWQDNSSGNMADIPGANSDTLHLNGITQGMNGRQYQCIITGICGTVTSQVVTLQVSQTAVAGTVGPDATVCSNLNSGTLTLSGQSGSIVRWESSTDGGSTWTPISNVSATLNYNNLQVTTLFHAILQSGSCPQVTSAPALITVNQSVTIMNQPANVQLCTGSLTTAVFSVVATGSGLQYQWQDDSSGNFTDLNGETASSLSLNGITMAFNGRNYRCIISGICGVETTLVASILISPVSIGGTVGVDDTLCSGTNNGTLTLSGEVGTIVEWQYSVTGGAVWIPIANTTHTLNFTNLSVTTQYRAVVQSGSCPPQFSSAASILINQSLSVSQQPVNASVCEAGNASFSINASGDGLLYQWQDSITSGFVDISGQNASVLTLTNVSVAMNGRRYRCILTGTCGTLISNEVTLTVSPSTVAGSVGPDTTVCIGINSGTLSLTGFNGNVLNWESSTNGGSNWTPIANTTSNMPYTNLLVTTMFRAVVKSGVCPSVASLPATVSAVPGANISLHPASQTVCEGSTVVFSVTATNATGFQWQDNSSGNFANIINETGSSLTLNNVTAAMNGRLYRCLVNGNCQLTSNTATLTVDAATVGGITGPDATVCSSTNSGTITLTGYVGAIQKWQISTNGGGIFTDVANTTPTLNYTNLTGTRVYRAVVKNGQCPAANSGLTTIFFGATTSIFLQPSNTTVCDSTDTGFIVNANGTNLTYQWQDNSTGTFANIPGETNNILFLFNVPSSFSGRQYRCIVTGGCGVVTSNTVTLTVISKSNGGTVNPSATVCAGNNSGTLTVSGINGSVIRWEFSDDNGGLWNPVANSTTSLSYSNVAVNRLYRAVVQNGLCPEAYSIPALISMNPLSPASFSITGSSTYCLGTAGSSLGLSGSEANVVYQLKQGAINIGAPIAGTGSPLSFGTLTAGSYSVAAENTISHCTRVYGPFNVSSAPTPVVSANATPSSFCPGGTATLSSSSTITTTIPTTLTAQVNTAIPNNSATGISSTILIAGAPTSLALISNLSITINAQHTKDDEFEAYLIRPGGSLLTTSNGNFFNTIVPGESICLAADNGGTGDDFTNTVFTDSAALSIDAGTPPFTGYFMPKNAISTLTGNPNGLWTLKMLDDGGGQLGTFLNWSISIELLGGVTYTWTSSPAGFNSSAQNPGAISPTISTNYIVTVTDNQNGCTTSVSAPVTVFPPVELNCSVVTHGCNGQNNGQIMVATTNGTPPFSGAGLKTGLSPGLHTYTVTDNNGCSATCSATIIEPPVFANSYAITECDSFLLPWGALATTTGIYSHVFITSDGCDSTVTIDVTINTSYNSSYTQSVCDSLVLPWGLAVYSSGVYSHNYMTQAGCDSILTADITVNFSNSSIGTLIGCDSVMLPWGPVVDLSGIYMHTYLNSSGCDSLVTLQVAVANSATYDYAVSSCDTLILPWGDTATISDDYSHLYFTEYGCDSVVTAHVTINTSVLYTYSVLSCDSFITPWNDVVFISGEYSHLYTTSNGCDSLVVAIVTIERSVISEYFVTSCDSYVLPWGGTVFASADSSHTYSTIYGCDSVVTAHITINYSDTSSFSVVSCDSYDLPWSQLVTASGDYTFTYQNQDNCDSVVTAHVTIDVSTSSIANISICDGASYTPPGGIALTVSGTYVTHILNAAGCDSMITTNLTVLPPVVVSAVPGTIFCNGGSTSVIVTATGGTGNYVNGTGTITGVPAGTYTYTVTDNLGCSGSLTITINEPAALSMTACTHTDPLCNGGGGAVSAGVVTGAVGPVIYGWRNSNNILIGNTPTMTGLLAGTYTLTVSDNCSSVTCSVTINDPLALDMSACSAIDAHCFGGTGTVSAGTVSNAVGAIIYAWRNTNNILVGSTPSVSGLVAGIYTLTVSDMCFNVTCSVTIAQPAALTFGTCSHTDAICNGTSTGSVTAGAVSNAVGVVQYTWVDDSNGSVVGNTSTVTNLPAGSYTLTVSDDCFSFTCTQVIAEPAALSMSACSHDNAHCNGSSTGSVSAGVVSGAIGTVSYSWSNSSNVIVGTTANVTGLPAGLYTLTVTDNCSSVTCSVTVGEPAALAMTACSHVDALCFGGGGSVSAGTVSNSVGQLVYTWRNSANVIVGNTPSVIGLQAGTYTLTVSDDCFTLTCTETISQPLALAMSACSHIDASCNGSSNGSVSAGVVSNAVGQLVYTWRNSANVIVGNTATVNNLPAGIYTLTVSDDCSSLTCIQTINEPAALAMGTCSHSDALCNGSSTGTLTAGVVSGAVGSLHYSWVNNGNGNIIASTANVNGVPAGSYTLTVSDDCFTLTCTQVIGEPPALAMTACSHVDAVCNGGTGTVSAGSVTGSVGLVLFTWRNSSNAIVGNTPTVAGLPAGTYTLTVSDNCSSVTCSETIAEPPALSMGACSKTDAICNGSSTGSVNAGVVSGVVGPLVYIWRNSNNAVIGTSPSLSGLAAGTYTLTVSDNCSSVTCTVTVGEPAALSLGACTHTDVLCNGGSNGSVSAGVITGAVGSLVYSWTNSNNVVVGTTPSVSNLPAGVYTLTVHDDCSTLTCIAVITEPGVLGMSPCSHMDATCNGGTGTVNAGLVSNAVGTIHYSWKNSSNVVVGSTPSVSNLPAGTYTLTVSDDCSSLTCSQTINEPLSTLAMGTCSHLDASCNGGTGIVLAGNITGAVGPLTYSWKNSSNTIVGTSAMATGLIAGVYTLTVSDNCSSVSCSQTILEPSALSMTACAHTDALCGGTNTGTLSAGTVSNVTGSVNYVWTNSSNLVVGVGPNVSGLPGGTYTLTVTDACSSVTCSQTINQPTPMSMGACSQTNAVCFGGTGSVSAGGISNAAGTVQYSWRNSNNVLVGTSSTVNNLPAGNYTLTATDGCTNLTCSVTITQPAAVTGSVSVTASGCSSNNGVITITPSGGTPGYSYLWSPGGPNVASRSGLGVGSYTIIITDSKGCTGSVTATVTQAGGPPGIPGSISGPSGACRNQTGVVFTIAPVAGASSYQWTLPSGASGSSTTNSITLNFSNSFSTGNLCVRAVNNCGTSSSSCRSIIRFTAKPPKPGHISGPSSLCPLNTRTYSVSPVNNATSYIWTVSGGLTIVSGNGTNSIQVNAPAGFVIGEISVRAANCQGTSGQRNLTVKGVPSTPIWKHSPPAYVCGGGCYGFNIDAVQDANTWTYYAPPGCVITSPGSLNGAGNPITTTVSYAVICFPSGFTSGVIAMVANNGCGESATLHYSVRSTPNMPGTISGPTSVCKSQSNVQYSVAAVPTASSYVWTVTGGAVITNGAGTRTVRVRFTGATSTNVNLSVRAVNSCGSSSARTLAISVNLNCRVSDSEPVIPADESSLEMLTTFPNPTTGKATLSFTSARADRIRLSVVDLLGKTIISQDLEAVEGFNSNEIDLENAGKGIYILSIQTSEGEIRTRRIIVQ